ncbi:hypothetical protein HFO55_32085 [Rhizobium leguminosarum]|nr:hypothetical protein [Rhizobium leguminosarum]
MKTATSGIRCKEGFARFAWTRMPNRAATIIAGEVGRMWKRSHASSMGLACRAPVSVVFAAVYSSFSEGQQAPEELAPAARDESTELKLRNHGDYRRLALQILNSQARKQRRRTAAGKRTARSVA